MKNTSNEMCPFCHNEIQPEKNSVLCPSCNRPYHPDCWSKNENQCAVFGCTGHTIANKPIISSIVPQSPPNPPKVLPVPPLAPQNSSSFPLIAILIIAFALIIYFFASKPGGGGVQQPTNIVPTTIPVLPATNTRLPLQPTNTIILPTTIKPTAKPLNEPIPSNYECPDKNQIELQVGVYGMVRKYDLNLRKEPIVPEQWDANIIRVLRDGEKLKIIGGPRCSHDGTWWEVLSESGTTGWAREMQPSKGRLIIRIKP